MFEKYFPNVDLTELWNATYETLYMTLISLLFAFVIGVILGFFALSDEQRKPLAE